MSQEVNFQGPVAPIIVDHSTKVEKEAVREVGTKVRAIVEVIARNDPVV